MKYRRITFLFALVSLPFFLAGCRPPSSLSQGGFAVSTAERTQSASGKLSPPRFLPNVHVWGNFYGTITGKTPYGTVQSYDGIEGLYGPSGYPRYCGASNDYNSNEYYWVCNGEAPANWTVSWELNFYCGNLNLVYELPNTIYQYQITKDEVFLTSGVEGDCISNSVANASTRFAIIGQLPQTLTLSGEAPYVTTYGMPELFVYDGTGDLVATEAATSVSSDGSRAIFPFPSSLQQNGYSVAVANQTGGSQGVSAVGTNYLAIASSQTIPGNPFGVAVSGQTNSWSDRNSCTRTQTNGSTYSTFPVVSLYSSNQVLIDGTPLDVGANPTAVAVFPAAPVRTDTSDSCNSFQNSFSGTTQAIVANSGGNTVTVLDIVNNAVLHTVTVGSQPVALVVTPDGSTAYVANYTDSTVTEVNLNTETPVTTVAVGGHPTSIALAAPSTLWVGGVGFLSQVNAQNMAVAATESTSGKTIAALGFSDAENELIATAVDASGNVSIDEVSPSSVYPGSAYTTAASHQVSTVGTYTNPYTHAQVQAFTATIGQTSVPINSNLPGAPPLVVQDGWAVVSATPTGFNITDASGHVVLVSETTPSPIAAIAVDTNLNVAYLTMPDSNTLLTVPLPGTGASGTGGASGSFAVTATNNNPAQTALSLGHSMSYTVNVSPVNGFAGAVALWVDGLPAGVTASLSAASINTAGNATLTLASAYSSSTYIGSTNVMVTGTGGGLAQSIAIPLTTQPLRYRGYCSVQ